MTDARNKNRIDVWPSYGAANAAHEDGGKLLNRMTVWPTIAAAKAHKHHGGGGSSYTAKAVHFDGGAILIRNSLIATDTNNLSVAGCFANVDTSGGPAVLYVSDPDNTYDVYGAMRNDGITGDQIDGAAMSPGSLSVTGGPTILNVGWHSFVASVEANNSSPQPAAIFIDGIDWSSTIEFNADPVTFIMNGLKFAFGGDPTGSNVIGDFADWRIDTRSWLVGGTLPSDTLALFRDPVTGKPVDPAVATAALGEPCILFSGDATGFTTNQGTGGAFTLTGTLTNASTSPSD